MYDNHQQREQKDSYHRKICTPSSSTLLRMYYTEQQPQEQSHRYQNHHLQQYNDNHHNQHHQKQGAMHCFPRCGLILLIFLSAIRESFTTMYSTSYPSSLFLTTVASTRNLLPYFDFDVPRNVTITVGQTGFLHCRVERLGDKDVSWIRKRDLHILTAGSTTYTSDQRFQVLRPENSGNWTLQIKYPQPRDSGIYECQINTEPKMSLSYTFIVVELKATLIGPTDLYVKSGSDINLTCKIIQGPHELGNIFWYKGSEIIDTTTDQNEIDSWTRITVENDWSDGLTSRLKIRRATSSDTGNYTCVPTIAKSSSVYVHVIIGEHPAAMQHNSSKMLCANIYISLCCMIFTILRRHLQNFVCTNISKSFNITKITITMLSAKSASTSMASFSMATKTSASSAVSTTTLGTKTRLRNKIQIPAATRTTQSQQHILLLFSTTKTQLIKISTSAFLCTNTSTYAATSTTCSKATLLVCNGVIYR